MQYGDEIAVTDSEKKITYLELNQKAICIGQYFMEKGIETVEDVPDILITQSFMMTEPKDQRKATNTMFLNRKQWLEILEENGFCNSEEFPGYGEYLEVLGQKLFYCTKE